MCVLHQGLFPLFILKKFKKKTCFYHFSIQGMLENGMFVRKLSTIANVYIKKPTFYLIDISSIIPFDLVLNFRPICRINRLLKLNRLLEFQRKAETHTNLPNLFRFISFYSIILILLHWNACFYFMLSAYLADMSSKQWALPLGTQSNRTLTTTDYLGIYTNAFYWSTLALTTISNISPSSVPLEMLYTSINYLIGLVIFATVVGNVTEIVRNLSANKSDFQQKVDSVKYFMQLTRVNDRIQERVIRWFNYSWSNSKGPNENNVLHGALQENLQAEVAINVHLDTLRRVHIFQDCEQGLLQELVTKLRLQMFNPMDYVCRKNDIGREMYIIKRGRLCVVSDDGKTIFAMLNEGSYFGEISILDIAGSRTGNRRTANVVSMGYSDLFCLTKADLWQALVEYPLAKKVLIEKGKSLLRKDNLLDENAAEETEKLEEYNNIINDRLSKLKLNFDGLELNLARLIAEYKVNLMKLESRITLIRQQLEHHDSQE
jgi:cyclic nucleotide gated channel alpha 3